MNIESVRQAVSLLEAGEAFALVTTLETKGSSPRHAGAWMIVRPDGSILGTVGGGPLEAYAIRIAGEVLETRSSRLVDYELTDADAAGLGMICGGSGRLLVEYAGPDLATTQELYGALLDLLGAGGAGWLVTVITTLAGDQVKVEKCLVDSAGTAAGDPVYPADTLWELVRTGGAPAGLLVGDRAEVHVQPVGAPETAYVFGAGHCGKSLVHILGVVGLRTVIIDDRVEFANADRFPGADAIVVADSFENVLDELPVDERSYLVIMTRGHTLDRIVLEQALRTKAGYVGMIGSKKKIARIFDVLREQGFGEEEFERVHAPIGLAIGAETPEEIAISIAAEIVQVRRANTA
jgi:xanthine dehydrogenase accessory factor